MTKRLDEFFTNKTRKRRILALDGGGVRGMFTIGVLSVLEAELRRRTGDPTYTLCRYFDLIGGTSTGAIIATSLAMGMSVLEVSADYKTLCPEIFRSPAWDPIAATFGSRFKSGPLTKALHETFGDNTLASPKLETGLALHLMRLDRGSAWILVNNPRWKYYGEATDRDEASDRAANKRYRLRDLVQASAAAPFYFRGRTLTIATDPKGKVSKEDGFFVDGGVSGNNNPTLEMLMAIRDPVYGFEWPMGPDQLYVLSIGTGNIRSGLTAEIMQKKHTWDQARVSLSEMINAVSQQHVALAQAMSRSERRWIINAEKGDQPSAPYLSREPMFDYQRIDVRLDAHAPTDERKEEHASAHLRRELTESETAELAKMDCGAPANILLLGELGEAVGKRFISQSSPRPVFDQDIR